MTSGIARRGDSAAERAQHYGGQADRDPVVTLVRLNGEDGAVTYGAVHSADAVAMTAEWVRDQGCDADTVPWGALPGAEARAAADMRARPRRSFAIIGTAVEGEWASWYLPGPQPPVPAAGGPG